ncbi:MAG TPA: ATP-dependent DNA helicase RecQ [Patescibacteria group bacterium]|jgi:ATP-dependent DNA helicase RecQ
MTNNPQKILKAVFGYDSFRAPQGEIINSVMSGKRTLALLPTGQGKSLCYQIPGLALTGLTIVISPLIALMKDQVDVLHKKGIAAHYVNSTLSRSEVTKKYQDIEAGRCQFLYVAPERLLTKRFWQLMQDCPPDFIAVDEAHCFSTWGHDFRPHYRDIPRFIDKLPNQPKLALFTATASQKVVEDLQLSFKITPASTFRGSFFRRNLFITTRRFTMHSQRFLYLVYLLQRVFVNQSGLIYVATRKQAEMLYQAILKLDLSQQLTIDYYHAGRTNEEKVVIQEKFINDDLKVVIATNAFGMGIDKANIRFVIHCQMPSSLENYVQEIGRAGRDGQFSWCELLFHPHDVEVHQRMQTDKTRKKARLSLSKMIDYVFKEQCHHQKILSYFDDPLWFETGCARCEYCSPFSQRFLKFMKTKLSHRANLPTFVAQQQLILDQTEPEHLAELLGVGLGMLQ